MRKILCSPSFAFDSANVKYGFWTWPKTIHFKVQGKRWKRERCSRSTIWSMPASFIFRHFELRTWQLIGLYLGPTQLCKPLAYAFWIKTMSIFYHFWSVQNKNVSVWMDWVQRQPVLELALWARCCTSPTWQLHAALSVYPQFWGHWAFIYSRYCSYSSLIHNDVLPTTRHVSEDRKLFDVGEIFFFCCQRRNKTLGTTIVSAWLILNS